MSPPIRYLFGNLSNRQIVAELALSSVQMDRKLNDWGNFRAGFKLDQSGLDNDTVISATEPGANFVIMERGDTPIWEGIIWTRVYQSQAKDVQITARTYEAFAEKQIIDVDFTRTNYEQRNLFVDLWTSMQSSPYRDLGIELPGVFTTVVSKDLTVSATDSKNYLQTMSSISDGVDGFDWTIDIYKLNNTYRRRLLIGYPQLGSTDAAGLSFDYPGAITNYYQTESMTNAGTNIFVYGAGEGSAMVVGTAIQQEMLDNGFKRYDVTVSRKDVEGQGLIDSIAFQLSVKRKPPLSIIKVFLKGDIIPEFGSYNLGDTATLAIIDPRHPNGFTVSARIVAFSYKPASDDTVEEVELVFEGDELNG